MQLLLVVALVNCFTAVSGQAAKIVPALQLVQSHVRYVNQRVVAFNGNPSTGTLDAVNINQAADDLGHAVEYATRVAQASSQLSAQDSEAVSAAVISLRPDVEGLLKNIAAKRPAFDRVVIGLFSVSKQVQTTLTDEKALTIALGNAIASKLSGAYREAAPLLLNEFSMAFDAAIGAYVTQSE
ncbi:uncharacterized protein MYCFIDRAFT_212659 [Pseudocercospora fijiensis CIRAD86]|uniref:Antigenic cell wall galactomannoprotein n=1 Tax=Pseudocercospora fijiensis (strain CIRAD86) TaxID=383855 RepID=M3AM54_PSEFD|nr:uncharacterized protein MYCFIDRAFT_212659 [Pseudocercospora fijiensis CIRAD86]EME78208.1 hypothetical protein MYCFIDRAFT_212659 [Pseudocercospora fijiensis CIRAD86]